MRKLTKKETWNKSHKPYICISCFSVFNTLRNHTVIYYIKYNTKTNRHTHVYHFIENSAKYW